jgi:hypothetical protein
MSGVEIIPVRKHSELKAFIDLPWRIYGDDPNWIPPIKSTVARLLDPRKHPFWRLSERELFLAKRDREIVGRIAAIVDDSYNRYRHEKMGVWGFFECIQDPEPAMALFGAAEQWIRNRGMTFLRGPLNPSSNYETGMLLAGFDSPPKLLMPYNPAYYPELVHLCGFRKEKDLLAFLFPRDYEPPEWSLPLAEKIALKNEITIRHVDMNHMQSDMIRLTQIYNQCWSNNWGFAPMTQEEMKESTRDVRQILDPDMAFFLCYKGEEIGVFFALPDANPLLKRFDGKMGLSALINKFRYWSEIKDLRILMFGVKEEYHQLGAPFVAFDHLMRVIRGKGKYQYIEAGWTLEDNHAINRFFVEGGAEPYKRYRIFRKDLQ